jgi:hypothetical protein
MMSKNYTHIVEHYEKCFFQHGDNHRGVDWPNQADLDTRFRVASEVMKGNPKKNISLLDFGCGNGLFIDYLDQHQLLRHIGYTGLDLSQVFIACCERKYPHLSFICTDVMKTPEIGFYDYIILNGVLTEKCSLAFEVMWDYAQKLLVTLFQQCHIGMAFNVMSANVDWKREDLFHVEFDLMATFLQKSLSRNYVFRNDYGLYEYTTYVYR